MGINNVGDNEHVTRSGDRIPKDRGCTFPQSTYLLLFCYEIRFCSLSEAQQLVNTHLQLVIVQSYCLCSNPYETSSAAAALQNDFKKRYKRAAKGLAAAVAKNGCFALQGKPFDSDKQRCCSGAENSRITICAAKWLRILRQRTLFPVMAYHSLVQKKKKCRLQ